MKQFVQFHWKQIESTGGFMTREEAIKILKIKSECYDYEGLSCQMDLKLKIDGADGCTLCEKAMDMAIEVLEKQIPFKPVIDRKWSRCKCGELALHYNYCPNCGQKLLRAGVKND